MGGQFSETKPVQNRSLCGNGPLQNVAIDLTPKSGRLRNGSRRKFTGQSLLLLSFSVPQFLFYVTTAYDILRHCGVDLAKQDFLGTQDRASQD
jgi:hypothetical protein